MKRNFLLKLVASTFLTCLFIINANAATITVLPNNGATSGNGRAPQGSRLYINTMYIILPSEMSSSGYGTDLITSMGWTWVATTGQLTATAGTLKVYVQSTTNTAYSKGTTFSTAGMTKIIDGTINIPAGTIPFQLDVPVGGPGTSSFSTVAGEGLYIAFEYQTTSALATTVNSPTVSCTNSTTPTNALGTYQSNTVNGTLMTLSSFRPETRIGNSQVDGGEVQDVYTMGEAPIPYGNPQPFAAKIKNNSSVSENLTVNLVIQEKATSTVRYSASGTFLFTAGQVLTISASGWNPTLTELDTAIVTVDAIAGETVLSNNSKGYRHNVNSDTYSYSDLSASNGGVGFGTGSGIIANKYTVTGCARITNVNVFISDVNSVGNEVYAEVLDAAGTALGFSDVLTVASGDVGSYHNFVFDPPISIANADFFVGLGQAPTVTVAYFPVGTQIEATPSRTNAYYSFGLGGGTPAGPYTTLGRFMIQAIVTTEVSFYADVDGDGYGDPDNSAIFCPPIAPMGYVGNNLDCNDADAAINPVATETCNGIDDDCDGLTDDSDPGITGQSTWYADVDNDGFGDVNDLSGVLACFQPSGTSGDNSDCDDALGSVNPAGTEVCNGIDDNCNGIIDEGVTTIFYADADGDTYGDASSTTNACSAPSGFVSDDTDCDDAAGSVFPGATEVCNGVDDNCDGNIDEGIVVIAEVTPSSIAICRGVPTTLNATTGVGNTYQWYKNGNLISGATSDSYSTDKSGFYQVEVTIPGGCSALSAASLVTNLPGVTANISALEGLDLCLDPSLKLKASVKPGYTYQWYFNASPISGETAALYFATAIGNYRCLITNTSGCSKFTPSVTVFSSCKESNLASELNKMNIYPNPSQGIFNLQMQLDELENVTAVIKITNIYGELIYSQLSKINQGVLFEEISLAESFASGIYFVSVQVGNKVFTQQIECIK